METIIATKLKQSKERKLLIYCILRTKFCTTLQEAANYDYLKFESGVCWHISYQIFFLYEVRFIISEACCCAKLFVKYRKWQLIEDVEGMWYTEWMWGLELRERWKFIVQFKIKGSNEQFLKVNGQQPNFQDWLWFITTSVKFHAK